MARRLVTLASAAAIAASGTLFATASPATAAAPVTVSTSCGQVTFNNVSVGTAKQVTEGLDYHDIMRTVTGGSTVSMSVPAGTYTWTASVAPAGVPASGRVVVSACSGDTNKRGTAGDLTGDGHSDVYGLTTGGELYFYSTRTNSTLNNGVRVGTGWGSMDWIGKVPEVLSADGTYRNYLLAHRTDGTVWLYETLTGGKLGGGTQIGTGVTGYANYAVTQTNTYDSFGGHLFTATKGGERYSWTIDDSGVGIGLTANGSFQTVDSVRTMYLPRFDADGWADEMDVTSAGKLVWVNNTPTTTYATSTFGIGWSAMQALTGPGDLDANGYSDLIARRSDGNLYVYKNSGAKFGTAMFIGQHWNGIKVLA